MSKLRLNDISNITGNPTSAEQTINGNSEAIEVALDNTISRDGTGPNYMTAELDMNSNPIINLGAPTGPNDAARLKDITSIATIDDLVVPPLDGNEDKYLSTDGENLIFLDLPDVVSYTYFPVESYETGSGVTIVDYRYPPYDVRRYGADPTGNVANVVATTRAFNDVARMLMRYGGIANVPTGEYLLNDSIIFDGESGSADGASIEFNGNGAVLRATSAVLGGVIKVNWNINNRIIAIKGFQFNLENNTTIYNGIKLTYASNVKIEDCVFQGYNTRDSFTFINVGPSVVGNDDTNSFWTRIINCTFRPVAGGLGTYTECCVRLNGAANHTIIQNCSFTSSVYGVELRRDATSHTLANSTTITECAFEGVTTAVRVLGDPSPWYWPSGLKILGCRFEAIAQMALSLELTSGTEANNHSSGPLLRDNWSAGDTSVAVWNPHNAFYTSINPGFYGDFADQVELVGGDKVIKLGYPDGNLILKNHSDTSTYLSGHLVLGDQHLWYNTGDGLWYHKTGLPSSPTDGTVLGTGSGSSGGNSTGSFVGTVSNDFTPGGTIGNVSIRWAKAGSAITCRIGEQRGFTTANPGTRFVIGSLPTDIIPKQTQRMLGVVVENNAEYVSLFEIPANSMFIYVYRTIAGAYFNASQPNSGWTGTTLCWNLVA